MGSTGTTRQFSPSGGQLNFESQYRNSNREHIGFFDSQGNLVFEASGMYDNVNIEASGPFNHNVEQRIWADEEINTTHNHPYESIFSTNDIEAFEELENHSLTATTPTGRNFRLIRDQPRTEKIYEYDPQTGDFRNIGYEPKKIAPAYDKEYSKVYDKRYTEIRQQYRSGQISREEYKKQDEALVRDTTKHMVEWLRKNAHKYGYIFQQEG